MLLFLFLSFVVFLHVPIISSTFACEINNDSMSYIEKNLMNGESIVTRAQLHAVVYVWPVVLAIASFVVMGFAAFTESYAYPVGVGVVMLVIALIWAVLIHDNRKYVLTNKRLIEKVGIVRRESREILLRKCEGVQLTQSVLGRILNYGTVTVSTTGDAVNDYKYIKDPIRFSTLINQQIDQLRDDS